jgi:hypothetical protein
MFNLKNAFYRKMPLCLSIFHLEKLSKPSCVLKESRTNFLLVWKMEGNSAKLPTTTITYRAKVNYFMIRSLQTQRSESLSELEFLNNLLGLGTE